MVLDITRPGHGDKANFEKVIKRFASNCFVPLTAGGGIRTIDDVQTYLSLGADKVVINSEALRRPEFVSDIARLYGSQCVVISIDAKRQLDQPDAFEVFGDYATKPTGRDPVEWARQCQVNGAGEVLITAVDKDGSIEGYDLELCRLIVDAVSVPVLVCGGAGNWNHFAQGFDAGASGVCTTNIYHFTEASIKSAKAYLTKTGYAVRV